MEVAGSGGQRAISSASTAAGRISWRVARKSTAGLLRQSQRRIACRTMACCLDQGQANAQPGDVSQVPAYRVGAHNRPALICSRVHRAGAKQHPHCSLPHASCQLILGKPHIRSGNIRRPTGVLACAVACVACNTAPIPSAKCLAVATKVVGTCTTGLKRPTSL